MGHSTAAPNCVMIRLISSSVYCAKLRCTFLERADVVSRSPKMMMFSSLSRFGFSVSLTRSTPLAELRAWGLRWPVSATLVNSLFLLNIFLQIVDGLCTAAGLQHGIGEGNPLIRFTMEALGSYWGFLCGRWKECFGLFFCGVLGFGLLLLGRCF